MKKLQVKNLMLYCPFKHFFLTVSMAGKQRRKTEKLEKNIIKTEHPEVSPPASVMV